jgi:outer membrane protein assembly factor BamB
MRRRLRPVLVVPAQGVEASPMAAPAVTVTPGAQEPTLRVSVHGSRFKPEAAVAVSLGSTKLATATPGPGGSFSAAVTIPRGTVSGTHVLTARQAASGDSATATLVVRVNWPDEHFNPRNTGYNNLETVLNRHNAATLTQTQSATTMPVGGIVEDNGLLLIAGSTTFQALNASTLATEWTHGSNDAISGIAAADGVVYLTVEDGTLDAYDEATGSFLWEYLSGHGPYGTPPIISGGVAYLALGTYVIAVDLTTHQALWTSNLGSSGISLALDGSTLYAVNATLYALDAATGATTWSTAITPADAIGGVPAIDAEGNLYIGTDFGVMDAYSSAGTLLWSDKLDVTGAFDPALDGTTLYTIATGNHDRLLALNTSDGSQLWKTPFNPATSSATVANGVVYAAADNNGTGSLNAYNAATGATLASYPLNTRGGPPALIANGTIYQGDDGVTALTPP